MPGRSAGWSRARWPVPRGARDWRWAACGSIAWQAPISTFYPIPSCLAPSSAAAGSGRAAQNRPHFPDPVLSDPGARARQRRRHPARTRAQRAQSGRRKTGAVSLCVPPREPARSAHRHPPIHRHSSRTPVRRRTLRHTLGLGYYIYLNGTHLFNYPAMYAGVLAMSLLGLGLYFAVDALEQRLCRWQAPSSR